jgi:phosphodiesterase/alkaline phosphatase D-like protein
MARRSFVVRALVLAVVAGTVLVGVEGTHVPSAQAAIAPQLLRYPYLTDVVTTNATVNFATDTSGTKATVKYGRVGAESCVAHTQSASKTTISVQGQSEYQWKAKLSGLQANTLYCYRVFLGSTDLLGDVASPQFWSQIPAGTTTPYSFAVFGDWGDTDANGANPYQAALYQSMANSGVRFAVGTGDTAYDSGTQSNYGDLVHTGYRVSSIFGPSFWPQAGSTIPLFNAVGNHGMNATYFTNWPQDRAVSSSSGKYAMETYCCANGATSQKSPSSLVISTSSRA